MSRVREILDKELGTAALTGGEGLARMLERELGVDSITELRGIPIDELMTKYGSTVQARGRDAAFDWNPKYYVFDPDSTAVDNGSSVIAPSPDRNEGRWIGQNDHRPLYNVIDSGALPSGRDNIVEVSDELEAAIIAAGDRDLYFPISEVASNSETSWHISRPLKPVHGLVGGMSTRDGDNSPASRIKTVPTGYSGTVCVNMSASRGACPFHRMGIYGYSEDSANIAALGNEPTEEGGWAFVDFFACTFIGYNDTYVLNFDSSDAGTNVINQGLNSIYRSCTLNTRGIHCKMVNFDTQPNGANSHFMGCWFNFNTPSVNSVPFNFGAASVTLDNVFIELSGVDFDAVNGTGTRALFSFTQDMYRIKGLAIENIAKLTCRNWDYLFSIQQGGAYLFEFLNSLAITQPPIGPTQMRLKALVTTNSIPSPGGSETYLRVEGMDWGHALWRDGASILEFPDSIGGYGSINAHISGVPANIEPRNLIKYNGNQAASPSTADPDRSQSVFVTGFHKKKRCNYEIYMDEGTGVRRWESSTTIPIPSISTTGADAATSSWTAPFDGFVQGLSLILNDALAGANLTVTVSINGVDMDTVMTVLSTETAGYKATINPAEMNSATFRKGDEIKVTMGGASTATPATANLLLELVQYNSDVFSLVWRGVHKSLWAEFGPKLAFARASTAYAPTDDGYWRAYTSNNPAWYYANHRWGLLIEPAGTNLVGSVAAAAPRDLTDANWIKTNCTAAKDSDGIVRNAFDAVIANSASTITATDTNATCILTTVAASAYHVSSAFVKRKTGTGTIEFTDDGGSTWTDITSDLDTSSWDINGVVDGWWRTFTATTQANPAIGFRIGTSGDEIEVDFAQVETSLVSDHADGTPYPTSPMETTRALATCSIDRDTGPWWNDANGNMIVGYSTFSDGKRETGTRYLLFGATTANSQFNVTCGGADSNEYPRVIMGNGVSDDTLTFATGQNSASVNSTPRWDDVLHNQLAFVWRTTSTDAAKNGVNSSDNSGGGYVDPSSWTELYIGGDSGGANNAAIVLDLLAFMPDFQHSSQEETQNKTLSDSYTF